MTDTPIPAPRPDDPPEDHERQTMVRRVQQAMADGQIEFDDIEHRFDAIYRARSRAELAAVAADLPEPRIAPPPEVPHPLPASSFSLLGDTQVGGWVDVEGDLSHTSVIGDIVVDLSSARLPEELVIRTASLFGDTVVIVPDGVRASLEATVLLGDRRVDLTPARPGAPTVRVKSLQALGDVKLYSLSLVPEGPFRRLWRRLRGGE